MAEPGDFVLAKRIFCVLKYTYKLTMRYILCIILACLSVWAIEPTEVAVVYNAESPISQAAALRYCEARRIPKEQLLPLSGLKRGDIEREQFEALIVQPLLQLGYKRGMMWPCGPRNGRRLMRAMVLMPDIPLRVKEEMINGKPMGTGAARTEAAVDSELMLLGAEFPKKGMGKNPHFKQKIPGKKELPRVLTVCRIDGPDEAAIFRMINEPVEVEKSGLWGWVVADNGGPYKDGDSMIRQAAELARKRGQPLFYESSKSTLADGFPLMKQVAVYFGWYTRNANGPFGASAPATWRLGRGSIAFHLHSYSAINIYDGISWVSALLKRGACVTAGNVAEPYLGACLNYGIFYEKLLAGAQVGEAVLVASPSVSWQGIVLGDPLYRPFPANLRPSRDNPYAGWQDIFRRLNGDFRAMQNAVEQKLSTPNAGLYAEMFAWYCTWEKRFPMAAEYFALAARRHYAEADKVRASLMQASVTAATGAVERALGLFDSLELRCAATPWLNAVKKSSAPFRPKPKPSADKDKNNQKAP